MNNHESRITMSYHQGSAQNSQEDSAQESLGISTSERTSPPTASAANGMRFFEADWLPEVRSGASYEALKLDIKRNGQISPIIIGTDDLIYDGRSRYRACMELGKAPVFADPVSPEDGIAKARAGLHQRQLTVLDEVQFVKYLQQSPEIKSPKGNLKGKLSQVLKNTYGWRRGTSPRHIQKLINLGNKVDEIKDSMRKEEILKWIRESDTVSDAEEKVCGKPSIQKIPKSPKAPKDDNNPQDQNDSVVPLVEGIKERLNSLGDSPNLKKMKAFVDWLRHEIESRLKGSLTQESPSTDSV